MTSVKFSVSNGKLIGFEISGHSSSSYNDEAGKIICSAVSSAAFMAANTLTEIIGAEVDANVEDGYMFVKLITKIPESQTVLKGLRLHLNELAAQYSKHIQVNQEV